MLYDIFQQLNERQLQAATSTEGMVRVVAGAGAGKTRVLAHRFAYLVNDLGISPANILCMTFTNKAAREMKQRISTMVDRGHVNDFICTIHGFCVKFLRREIYRIGYPKTFTVFDEEDCKELAVQAMEEFGIDRRKTTAERFLKQVAGFKGYDPDGYIQKHLLPASSPDCPDAIVRYLRLQLKHFALDFDDLQYFTLYILRHFEEARLYWTDKLNYIMVDEVQDCSSDDWALIYEIAKGHRNLFVVGDPDQAIYEWRGAKPAMFVNFKADTNVVLATNYRSTPQVLDVANSVINNNHNRIPKDLLPTLPSGALPTHFHGKTEKEESEWIAKKIVEAHKQGVPYAHHAVLYRSSFLSRRLEQELLRLKIPYTMWGGVRFFERREVKDIISYLRLINDTSDDMAFRRIINLPARKFGKASLQKLSELAEREGRSLYDTLAHHIDDKAFKKPTLAAFLAVIERARLTADLLSVSELTNEVLQQTGLTDIYRTAQEEDRLENVNELIAAMHEYEATHDDDREAGQSQLSLYLQDVALYTNADYRKEADTVRLMTIHQAKGLEFPTVFVAGLSEGIFPNHRSIRERRKDGEEEERRLMYVAVTRAMKQLYLTESEGAMNNGSSFKYPSRFFAEIPEKLIVREGCWDEDLMKGTRAMMSLVDEETCGDSGDKIPVGAKVRHRIFGEGEVLAYDRANDSYRVKFGDQTRMLLPRVLELLS